MTKRVLIVEDSQDIIELVRRSVGKIEGCTVDGALNGGDGLLAIATATEPYDIIILDLSLPDIDGLEFLRRLAERSFSGAIVLASGHNASVLASARRLAGYHGFDVLDSLQKPFSPGELRKLVEGYSRKNVSTEKVSAERTDDMAGAKLVPYYQPQFDVESGSVVGFEALIRVQLHDGPLVGPSALFSHMRNNQERISVALDIAKLVLRDLAYANSQTSDFPGFSINFDARVLEDEAAMSQFTKMVETNGVGKNQITVEVIEKSLPHSDVRLLETLTRLSMAGFRISLDDYGVGGSNLDLLRRCPFDEVKLDHMLIQSGLEDAVSRKFVSTAVETARTLGIRLVGEGVESVKDLSFVKEQGIKIVQGFLFERPMPIERALPFAMSRHVEEMIA